MTRFHNLHINDHPVIWSHLLKIAKFYPKRQRWRDFDPQLTDASSGPAPDSEQTIVSVLGHATILLRTSSMNILIDPVWASAVGPLGILGPRRQQPITPLASLPRIDLILISHDHYDHLDLKALQWLCRHHKPLILTGQGVGQIIRKRIPAAQLVEMQWWESYSLNGHRFTFVPAQHFSGRSLWMNNTLWGGFVAEINNEVFYYVGDSGYQEQILEQIRDRFPQIDLALIPIGSYEPYELLEPYHLSPQDAVKLFEKLSIRKALAVHFGTFPLSLENAERQVKDFLIARQRLGSEAQNFILPAFGVDYMLECKL